MTNLYFLLQMQDPYSLNDLVYVRDELVQNLDSSLAMTPEPRILAQLRESLRHFIFDESAYHLDVWYEQAIRLYNDLKYCLSSDESMPVPEPMTYSDAELRRVYGELVAILDNMFSNPLSPDMQQILRNQIVESLDWFVKREQDLRKQVITLDRALKTCITEAQSQPVFEYEESPVIRGDYPPYTTSQPGIAD